MSGTIFGLGLSQRNKSTGKPESGWRLYIYQAGTNTPATAYKDTGLTAGQEHPFPILADASGMMPAFWLADGSYRVRGTSSTGGNTFFDLPSVLAIGASSGSGGGGGGGTVDSTTIFNTGDVLWLDVSGTRTGWVRDNGRSIGSAVSGASERPNADCEALFEYLWTKYSDTICPVSTGRGGSAAADWAADKTITLPDKRGRSPFGLDDMGASAASRFTGVPFTTGNATTAGSVGGESTHTTTLTETPAHDHSGVTGDTQPTASFPYASGVVDAGTAITVIRVTDGGNTKDVTVQNHHHSIASAGSGQPHNNTPLLVVGTFFRKL